MAACMCAAGPVESSETPAVSAPRQAAPIGSDDGSDDEFDHTHKPSVRNPPTADSTSGDDSDVDVAPAAKPKSRAAVEEEEESKGEEEEEEEEQDAVETFMQTSMDDSRPSSPAPRPTSSRGRDAVSAAPAPMVKPRRMSDEVSDLSVEEMF
jgi:hypothetical protein